MKFKIGDRVAWNAQGPSYGIIGTIIHINEFDVCRYKIKWDTIATTNNSSLNIVALCEPNDILKAML